MDDPLKPKAVPLAAETVLWFEFLLDPELITKHLKRSNPEPSALELMSQFISMTPDVGPTATFNVPANESANVPGAGGGAGSTTATVTVAAAATAAIGAGGGVGVIASSVSGVPVSAPAPKSPVTEGLRLTYKQLALKILALKVATWLKWNLDIIEKHVSLPKQMFLLRDLCTISFGKKVVIPFPADFQAKITSDGSERAARFALTFYHRWVLRLQIIKDFAVKSLRPSLPGSMLIATEPMHQVFAPDIPSQSSIEYLQNLCKSNEPFFIFTYESFIPLKPYDSVCGEALTTQKFEGMLPISLAELRTQIYFDLVNFYLYTKQYHSAREAVGECRHNLNLVKAEYEMLGKTPAQFVFCHIKEDELEGYLLACGISAHSQTLTEKFNLSTLTQYKDIIDILKLDNRKREISLVTRRIVEFDIQGAISQGLLNETRQLEMQVAALNVVRSLYEEGNIFANVDFFDKYQQMDCFSTLVEYIQDVLLFCSSDENAHIKQFLIDAIIKNQKKQWVTELRNVSLFDLIELQNLEQHIEQNNVPTPPLALQQEWKFHTKLPRIEIGSLERQMISCTNANTVRKLLVKLAATNPIKPLWTVNPSWEIATPVKSVLMSMQPGFLQDFAYVLLGKARELTAKQDYIGAVSLLSVLKSDTQRPDISNAVIITKLSKLISWEILLIQITQCLEDWNCKPLDLQSLGNRSKQCLNSLQSGDTVIPRIEIVESCSLMLLNLNEWNSLIFLDKRLPQLELPMAFAATFIDMEKLKGSKKVCRDAWDLVLSIFLNNNRRGNITASGNATGGGSNRNSPCLAVSTGLQPFFRRIRHQTVFTLAISILGKIHNLLKDDPNYDLNGEYMQLWPTTLNSPLSSYNIRSVGETLHWLLTEALKYYPQMISWLKMKGDLELAIGNNEAAMRCYVNALITGTDYCTIALQRNVADDYIIRKMIRCCSNLGCYMQATILCQFLEEIDYAIVFKNLTEKSANFTDAMDAYYNCIWDTTLLEFIINLHAKKGEHSRKLEAVAIMGSLELNANNNDEIKREAAAVRKCRFLRALAKQYLL